MTAPLWYLYTIRLPVNDYAVAYVGVTRQNPPRGRFRDHCNSQKKIGRVIRLCGRGNCVFEVIESGDYVRIVDQRERAAIAEFNTRWPNGYNMDGGGFAGREQLQQSLAKRGATLKGHAVPADVREKISATLKQNGFAPSLETRRKGGAAGRTSETRLANLRIANAARRGIKKTAAEIAKRQAARRANDPTYGIYGGKLSPAAKARRNTKCKAKRKAEAAARWERRGDWRQQNGAKISAGKKGKPWSPARRAAFAQNKIRDMAAELRELRGETRPEPDAPCVVLPFPNKAAKRRAA